MDDRRISVLKNPYPYKAMLSICSDLDETESAEVYFNTSRYLNSKDRTAFGEGVGLEVGNSMYFYMPDGEFSYWNASESDKGKIRELMRAGLIDCMHSYGDLATERRQAAETLTHLDAAGCRLSVWIDHAVAPSNFGSDIMRGFGDLPDHPAYHADLTLDYGIRYLSMGRVTSMPGQDAPISVGGIYDSSIAKASLVSLAKEASKVWLGLCGNEKYAMHKNNKLLSTAALRDGQVAIEFLRSNPNSAGVSAGDTSKGLANALTAGFLERIIHRRARSVIYTHLGKEIDRATGFPANTRKALEELSGLYEAGEVLVTTTRRLLDYAQMHGNIQWRAEIDGDRGEIEVSSQGQEYCYQGLCFRVPEDMPHRLMINGVPVDTATVGCRDEGMSILTVPWTRLT